MNVEILSNEVFLDCQLCENELNFELSETFTPSSSKICKQMVIVSES